MNLLCACATKISSYIFQYKNNFIQFYRFHEIKFQQIEFVKDKQEIKERDIDWLWEGNGKWIDY